MAARANDLSGLRFGGLIALRAERVPGNRKTFWLFQCDCGTQKIIRADGVIGGAVVSCGCIGAQKRAQGFRKSRRAHGMIKTREYYSWAAMIQRCTNEANHKWPQYGGRGIAVCDRWRNFKDFYADMGRRPLGTTLDRRDNDGHYEPGNCRWATPVEQRANQRRVIHS